MRRMNQQETVQLQPHVYFFPLTIAFSLNCIFILECSELFLKALVVN